MTLDQAISILRDHNEWRRGLGRYADPTGDEWAPPLPPAYAPAQIGEAIDTLCDLAEQTARPALHVSPAPRKRRN